MAGAHGSRRIIGLRRQAALLALVASMLWVAAPAGGAEVPRTLHVNISVPSVLAASGWKIWVANTGTASVLEFDARTGVEVRNIHGHKYQLFDSDAMVVVRSQVWVANSASDSITILGAKSGDLVRILHGGKDHFGTSPIAMVVDAKHVFVLGQGGNTVVMLSAVTDKVVRVLHGAAFHFDDATALAASGQTVWVLSTRPTGSLTELSGATGAVMRVIGAKKGGLDHPTAMSATGNLLWISNGARDHLTELEASSGKVVTSPRISSLNDDVITSIVVSDNRLWLASTSPPTWVSCVRSDARSVVRSYLHRFGFPAVFSGAGHVWVVDRTQSRVTELNPSTGAVVRVLVN